MPQLHMSDQQVYCLLRWVLHYRLFDGSRRGYLFILMNRIRNPSSRSKTLMAKTLRNNHGCPDSKVHGTNIGPIWGHQDPGGPHVGPMNLAIWVVLKGRQHKQTTVYFHKASKRFMRLRHECLNWRNWPTFTDDVSKFILFKEYFDLNVSDMWS